MCRHHRLAGAALAACLVLGAATPVRGQSPEVEELLNDPTAILRVTMGQALGEHAFLTVEAMRTGVEAGDDFEAAAAALEGNSQDIVGLFVAIYGPEVEAPIATEWRDHIGYLVDYTRALEAGDEVAAEAATHRLHEFSDRFSALLAEVNPTLPQGAARALLENHIDQLAQIAAFDEGRYAQAYPSIRASFAHMFDVADALADAIAEQFPEDHPRRELAFSQAVDVRSTLARLFGEHTLLSGLAMRAALTDAPDRQAAAGALTANSVELAAWVGSLYGDEAGDAFEELWRRHIDAYLAYVEATAAQDASARESALAALADYRTTFSDFLAEANPVLSAADLDSLLGEHVELLVAQVDAYHAGDYEMAYGLVREAYAHTAGLAAGLAAATVTFFPSLLPNAAMSAAGGPPATVLFILLAGAWLALAVARARGGSRD